ncbi:MAG TPA: DUF1707 domain-containing protein [Streptosporangiaceae bacterium]|nr:DUF1707 domain-containing protein [Streptosporangiaceae bacterium]
MGSPMVMHNDLRVCDAERNSVAAELREHFVQGRLTLDELKERLDAALTAKTRGQLDGVMNDLPSSPGPRSRAPQPVWPGIAARYAVLAVFIIVLASWVITAAWFSHHGYYWYSGPGYYGSP